MVIPANPGTVHVPYFDHNLPPAIEGGESAGEREGVTSGKEGKMFEAEGEGVTPRKEGQMFESPINEEDLVKTLTEHAHKIASNVLDKPGTGMDLGWDAQVRLRN